MSLNFLRGGMYVNSHSKMVRIKFSHRVDPGGCSHLHLPSSILICHCDRMIPYVNELFEGRNLCEIHTIKQL
jgi:hypothetical protein